MTALRKPLLFLLVLACAASLAAGGRFSLRLMFDTAIALAAVPVIQVFAFAVVYWTGRRPVTFAAAVDGYFAGSGPWFAALAILGLFGAVASPVLAARWFSRIGLLCAAIAVVASVWIDFHYFRQWLRRGRWRAVGDVAVQRTLGWSLTLLYLLLTAVPKAASFLPEVAANVLGARP